MIKIVFISGTPISKIVGDKIDPYWYQDHGFEVEYWGMQNIYYDPASINAYFSENNDYKYIFPNTRRFCSKNEVALALNDLDEETIICFIDFWLQNDFWILRLFKKYKVSYYIGPRSSTIQVPVVRGSYIKEKIKSIYKKVFKKNFVRRVNSKILKLIFRYTDYYQQPAHVFSCGAKGRAMYADISRKSNYISIPSADILWNQTQTLLSEKYCVYVENNFHFSPDTNMAGEKNNHVEIKLFEKNICGMFDIIEEELGVKIVISASGKYIYPDENIFGDREIIYYKTNQLIQHSEMVIGHFSQGLSQAIVSLKPIMLIQDNSFSLYIKNIIDGVAKIFNITPICATKLTPSQIREQFVIDKKHYKYLQQEYYREEGDEIDAKDLIRNTIKNFMAHRLRKERIA